MEEVKKFRIVQNQYPSMGYRIEELWEGGAIRTTFGTVEAARKQELAIAEVRGWNVEEKGGQGDERNGTSKKV